MRLGRKKPADRPILLPEGLHPRRPISALDWPAHDVHVAARRARAEAMRTMAMAFVRWLRTSIATLFAGPGEDPDVEARRRFFAMQSDRQH